MKCRRGRLNGEWKAPNFGGWGFSPLCFWNRRVFI